MILSIGAWNAGDWAAVGAAVGTVGAFGVGFWQIRTERKRRHELESADAEERRIRHARRVSCYLGPEVTRGRAGAQPSDPRPDVTTVHVINGSDEPVYKPVVGIVAIQGAAPRTLEDMVSLRLANPTPHGMAVTTASIIPPGSWRLSMGVGNWDSFLSGRIGAEIAFTDVAGLHWIRRASGQHEQLSTDPHDLLFNLGYHPPYDLQTPEPV